LHLLPLTMMFASVLGQRFGIGKHDTWMSYIRKGKPYNLTYTQSLEFDCPINGYKDAKLDRSATSLAYQGGSLIQNVELYPIFWSLPDLPVVNETELTWFYQDIVGSSYMETLASEFSIKNQPIGLGSYGRSFTYNTSTNSNIDMTDIHELLAQWISNGTLPSPNGNTYFAIHFGPGINVTYTEDGETYASCIDFCGYHTTFDNRCATSGKGYMVQYGVVTDTSSSECYSQCGIRVAKSLNTCPDGEWDTLNFDTQTVLSSHELIESITDPYFDGWTDKEGFPLWEIADICESSQSFVVGKNVRFNQTLTGCRNSHKQTCSTIKDQETYPRYAVQPFFSPSQDKKCVASLHSTIKVKNCNMKLPKGGLQKPDQKAYTTTHASVFTQCPPTPTPISPPTPTPISTSGKKGGKR